MRVWQLNKAPVELFGDEIDVGLQAYSISKTGKDYFGNTLPIMFHSFSEYRLPFFIYSAVPFINIFGLNEWGVRLTGVFWGLLGIIGIFLLAKDIFNFRISIIAGFLLAITPWHLQYSRQAGIESGMLLTFIIFAVWFFIKGLKKYTWLLISVLLFSLSIYVYATALIFVVILSICLLTLFWKDIKKQGVMKITLLVILCFVILIPYTNLYSSGKAGQRFSTISIFGDKDINDEIFSRRNQEAVPFSSIFHNRFLTFGQEIGKNYLRSFSTEFLFVNGDPNLRQSVGGVGEFFIFELILILLGFYVFFKKGYKKEAKILLFWLLIAPIPSSLTKDGGYHASRLMLMLAPLVLFAALGLNYLTEQVGNIKKILLILITGLAVLNITIYLHRYYTEWPKDSFRFWQGGYKEAISYIKTEDLKYSRIYFNNTYEPALPRFMFWYAYDPIKFQKVFYGSVAEKDIVPGFNGFKLEDKYYFGILNNLIEDKGFAQLMKDKELYLVSVRDEVGSADWESSPPVHLNILKKIYNPVNRKPILFVVTKKDVKND